MPPAARDHRDGDRLRWLVLMIGLAVALGGVGALVTVGFIKLLDQLTDLIWIDVPDALGISADAWGFLVAVCTVGGVLVGLCNRFLGSWPKDLETALADFRRDRAFDYRHLPNSLVAALVALSFGGALGPEAALVAIIGGIGSRIARLINIGGRAAESVEYVGVMAALGTLFGTAGAAVLPLDEGEDRGAPSRWLLLVPGFVAAGAGAAIFAAFSSGDGYFEYHFRSHDLALSDLWWAVVATAAGALLALVYLGFERVAAVATTQLADRPVARGALGGLGLGLLASASTLVLFSGHEGIQELIDDTGASTAFLVGVAAAKVEATALLLATGWRGGRFFPIMFGGAAAGLALAAVLPDNAAMVALAGAMTAAIAVIIRRPLASALLMVFVFPFDLYPVVAIAAVLGAILGRRLLERIPALHAAPG